jgi:hypothetical protein
MAYLLNIPALVIGLTVLLLPTTALGTTSE